MTKFTPGKWTHMNGTDIFEDFMSGRQIAACLVDGDIPYEQQVANARLTAAAPAMWVAIRNLVTALDDGRIKLSDNNRALIIETHLRAALELAGGSESEIDMGQVEANDLDWNDPGIIRR